MTIPANNLGELILGNVPTWVYYYPPKETYLWQLTVLQRVAVDLAVNLFMRCLTTWEENCSEILDKIQRQSVDRIDELCRRGKSSISLPQVLSVSKELH